MKNLFERRSFAFLLIATFLVGGFFVGSHFVLADDLGSTVTVTNQSSLETALASSTVTNIVIGDDFTVNKQINITRKVDIDGNNKTISKSGAIGDLATWHSGNAYVLQVYGVEVSLKNISLTNSNAALLVNHSGTVNLSGKINVSGNGFGGIESYDGSVLNIDSATISNTSEDYGKPTIWEDGATGSTVFGANNFIKTSDVKAGQIQYYLDIKNSDHTSPTIESIATTTDSIIYTFSEPVKLVSQSGGADAKLDSDSLKNILAIYEVKGGNYGPNKTGIITSATFENKKLTVKYSGLEKNTDATYTLDAWGYDITDLADNIIAKSQLTNGLFTITGDTAKPTVSSIATSTPGTIVYNFSEPVQLLAADNITPITDYTGAFAIYEKTAYLAHNFGEAEPAQAATVTGATLSGDAKSVIITYTGSLIKNADTSYVVDAWGKNITDLVGNKMAASNDVFFTITGDTEAPKITISRYDSETPAKTITVTASTNEGTLNTNTHTFTTNNSSFDFVATDAVGNISTSTVTVSNIVDESQTVPDEDGEVEISSSTPEVVISTSTQPLIITILSGTNEATINYDSLITNGAGLIPQTKINSAAASIEIPASIVTSASTTWDGVMAAPKVTVIDLPVTSGQTKTLSSAIELGFSGAKLSFDKAVKITMPGQASKRAGYTRNGEAFTEITNICAANNQTAGDALAADSECKIDSGADLVIWTKHFTTFATYTQTTNSSGGGGGGVSYVNYCSSVTYGDWGVNTNGFQYRDILTQYPANCSLTVSQQLERSRTYVAVATVTPVIDTTTSVTPIKQVLGEKKYANGTLLKGVNNKIYVVKDNALIYIPNLKELAKYRGPILKVGDDVIASFSKTAVLGAKKYTDGTLIKAKGDTKIYVIKDGKKVHIKSLAELRTYKGKTLTVEAGELSNY